jgi:hypothetical protein
MSPATTWTPALDGATIRSLYPGRSAPLGILAVDLRRAGFTGLADASADGYGSNPAERRDGALALEALGALLVPALPISTRIQGGSP